jgi:hypothetical protein
VKGHENGAATALKRLYDIKDVVDDLTPRRSLFPVDGTFKIAPASLICEGEFRVGVGAKAIVFDKNAVSVIKGGAQIMESIAQNGWSMRGESPSEFLPPVWITVRDKGLCACSDVRPNNVFEMVDVMCGPLGL